MIFYFLWINIHVLEFIGLAKKTKRILNSPASFKDIKTKKGRWDLHLPENGKIELNWNLSGEDDGEYLEDCVNEGRGEARPWTCDGGRGDEALK